MTLRSRDIPDGLKRQWLKTLRERMGESQYRQAVDSVGEDGLVDLILSQTAQNEHPGSGTSQTATSAPSVGCAGALAYLSAAITHPIYCGPYWCVAVAGLGKGSDVPGNSKVAGGLVMTVLFMLSMVAWGMEARDKKPGCLGSLHALYLVAMLIVGLIWVIWGLVQLAC